MHIDFRHLRDRLPARAEAGTGLHEVRLKNELCRMIDAHLGGGLIQLLRIEGAPPFGVVRYDVVLRTPCLAYACFPPWLPLGEIRRLVGQGLTNVDSIRMQQRVPVRIDLPPTHPDRAQVPRVVILDHRVFHPSVLGPAICWADRWRPTTFLVQVLEEIAGLLRFERPADLAEALNPQAARWLAVGHPGVDLPLGSGA